MGAFKKSKQIVEIFSKILMSQRFFSKDRPG